MRALQKYLKTSPIADWAYLPLKQVARLEYGSALSDSARETGNVPVYGSNGQVGTHNHALVKGPGIVVGRKGTAGEVVWSETDFFPIDTTYYVETNQDQYHLRWLYHLLKDANLGLLQASTGVPGLSREDAYKLRVPVPEKQEQERIASTLDNVDAAITAIQASIAAAQKLKLALMQNLLTGKLKPDGTWRREDEFEHDPKFGRVPKGWAYKRIQSITNSYAGATPSRSDETFFQGAIPWVKSSELKNRFIGDTEEKISDAAFAASSTKWIDPNTVLFAMYGATAGDVSILRTRACSNQAVLALPAKDAARLDHMFLYYALKLSVPRLIRITQGGGQPNLSKAIVDKAFICLPDDVEEQKSIATGLDRVDDIIERRSRKLDLVGKLKKSLMQNLLTGKVRIPAE